jgi:uncharacterized spore protein YtfJ
MQDTSSFNSNMDTLFSDLQDFVKTGSVLGAPIKVEDKTIVPLMSVTMGYGSTGMGAKTSMGNGGANTSSGGVGLGARVSTSGIIVVDKDQVQILPANGNNNMSQFVDKIPEALSNLGQSMMGQNVAGQGQQQGQAQSQNQNQQQNTQKSQQ